MTTGKRLAFRARSTSALVEDGIANCDFEGERGCDLGLMTDSEGLVRMYWRDGATGEDEAVIGLKRVRLSPERVSIDFDPDGKRHTRIPYLGVDVDYEDVDDRFLDFEDVFQHLLADDLTRLEVDRPAD